MLCREPTALTACLALADEGLPQTHAGTLQKGSVTFKLRVLDLCFPRGAQQSISVELYPMPACLPACPVLSSVCELYHAATHYSYRSGHLGR